MERLGICRIPLCGESMMRCAVIIVLGIITLMGLMGCDSSDGYVENTPMAADTDSSEDVRPNTLTYDGLIQPILYEWCGDCHVGERPEDCSGDTCFVNIYEHLFVPSASKACDTGFNVGECGLYRIEATKNPNDPQNLIGLNGPIIVPDDEVEMLRVWIRDLGMPKN